MGLMPDQPVYRILIAEDREANRKLLVNMLAPIGFEVREAVNGLEAVELWERWEPHLIWMDLRMPVLDGYEATRRIKATAKGQGTVIVALTASAFDRDQALLLSGGCDDFLRKPFREEEIFETLAKHLGVRFVYKEEKIEDASLQPAGAVTMGADALTPDAIAALPQAQVADLHRAAEQLDGDLVLQLLDQIPEQHTAVVSDLRRLVRDFRFDIILALTEPVEG